MSSELLREAQDPNTTADRLMQIAQSSRESWEAVAVHPAAYQGLLDWLQQHGDDAVRAAIARRDIAHLPPPPLPPTDAAAAAPTTPIPSAPAPTPEQPTTVQPAAPVPSPEEPTTVQPAAPAAPAATTTATPAAAPAEAAATQTDSGAKGGSANVVRIVCVVIVLAALVAGGWFGVQALTGDDDKNEQNTIDVTPLDKSGDDATGSDDVASGDFCDLVEQTQDLGLSDIGSLSSGGAGPDELKTKLDKVRDVYRELEDVAPADLKDDVATVGDFFEGLGNAYSSGTPDPSALSSLDSAEFTRAGARLSQYYAANCM